MKKPPVLFVVVNRNGYPYSDNEGWCIFTNPYEADDFVDRAEGSGEAEGLTVVHYFPDISGKKKIYGKAARPR